MGHSTDNPPLTSVQQCVVDALAAGSTLTDTAETYGVHRVTIYRWMKTSKPFAAALHRARAEFVLARRDDLHHLSNRALETLLAVLDNPKASPAVQLRAAMFILQRPQLPKTGWSMPEPAPDPDGKKLLDSAIIEQDYDSLPGLCNIEREDPVEEESSTESSTYESEPPAPDATVCNQMQHDFENCDDVAPAPAPPQGLRSCPVPPDVLKARNDHRKYLELLDMIKSIEQTPVPKIEKEDSPAATEANEEEILV
jgi:transposase-like protein